MYLKQSTGTCTLHSSPGTLHTSPKLRAFTLHPNVEISHGFALECKKSK